MKFLRRWDEYRQGFGELRREFWLGNDKLHRVSLSTQELLIELGDHSGNTAYASYSSFFVGPESDNYRLRIGSYSGSAGDSLSYHKNMLYSTIDAKNNLHTTVHCADRYQGAWWYNNCYHSNLNGLYTVKDPYLKGKQGIIWVHWKGHKYYLKKTMMKVRPTRGKENQTTAITDGDYISFN